MAREEDVYIPALQGKNIPILVIDPKWKLLFPEEKMTPEIKDTSKSLLDKIDEQQHLREESKKIKKIKKNLMSEIIGLRDKMNAEGENSDTENELDEHTRLIGECNERLDSNVDKLGRLPQEIYDLNFKLMVLSMAECYTKLKQNTDEISEIDDWLHTVRMELKKKVIRKQEGEIENFDLYSYMHQIFGPEVIDIFDMKYNPDNKHPKRTP